MWMIWTEYKRLLSLLLALALGGGSVAGYRMMADSGTGAEQAAAVNEQMEELLNGGVKEQAPQETIKPTDVAAQTAASQTRSAEKPAAAQTEKPAASAAQTGGEPSVAPSSVPRTGVAAQSGTIDLNAATLSKLMDLPGIGESKAKAIIEYREKNGRFKTKEELMNVKGIGQKTFDALKERISVSP